MKRDAPSFLGYGNLFFRREIWGGPGSPPQYPPLGRRFGVCPQRALAGRSLPKKLQGMPKAKSNPNSLVEPIHLG